MRGNTKLVLLMWSSSKALPVCQTEIQKDEPETRWKFTMQPGKQIPNPKSQISKITQYLKWCSSPPSPKHHLTSNPRRPTKSLRTFEGAPPTYSQTASENHPPGWPRKAPLNAEPRSGSVFPKRSWIRSSKHVGDILLIREVIRGRTGRTASSDNLDSRWTC
jgi:hypothetical protein